MTKLTNPTEIFYEENDHSYLDSSYGEEDASNINAFHRLGIGPQILKRLKAEKLRSFLRDLKKIVSKHFHPDSTQDPYEKKLNELMSQQFNVIFDSLLQDPFYFDKQLAELQDRSYEGRLISELEVYKRKSQALQKELDEHKQVLEKQGYRILNGRIMKISN